MSSASASRGRVLVTGASGRVGRLVAPALSREHRLRFLDVRAVEQPDVEQPDVEQVVGDIADAATVARAVRDVDVVVHLAADPRAPAPWSDLRTPNVEGVQTVLSEADRAGVRRVVLASSVHAAGGYVGRGQVPVDPAWPASPCCPYGATKAFAEALGAAYSYRTGLSVLCLRLGGVVADPTTGGGPTWVGPEDVRQLVVRSVEAPEELSYGVYHGISRSELADWELTNAERDLGYVPTCEAPRVDGDPTRWRSLCRPGPI